MATKLKTHASAGSVTVPAQPMATGNLGRGLRRKQQTLSVVVLASGSGTNLQAILDKFQVGSKVKVVGVASNKPAAQALERARRAGIEAKVFERDSYSSRIARDAAMAAWIKQRGAGLVVAAGYMEILSPGFVNQFRSAIINIHPSLLPAFRGLNAIQQAFDAGVPESGVTVHIVDEGVDTGPVLATRSVSRTKQESMARFEERIHAVEHELLPDIIEKIAAGEVDLNHAMPQRRTSFSVQRLGTYFAVVRELSNRARYAGAALRRARRQHATTDAIHPH